jgi:hypothetical protein
MKSFAALTFLLALATASPVEVHPRDEGGSLAKRDTEIIYLANCKHQVSCCTPEGHYSQIAVSFTLPLIILMRHQPTYIASVLPG